MTLVLHEEEELVLPNRTAEMAAIEVVTQAGHLIGFTIRQLVPFVEIVVGVEVLIFQIVIEAAMELVGAAFGDDVDGCRAAAVFGGIGVGLELHLLNGVLVGDKGTPRG